MKLPRKQVSEQADWLVAWDAARAAPDRARAGALVAEAAERVRSRLEGALRPAFGWSGGKDSLALEVVARAAGVDEAVLVISGLEYPAFLAWATDNMPWRLTVECRAHLNLGWLKAHPRMLFPGTADIAARWFAQVQHAGQRHYAREHRTDVLLLGRRRADGNHMGAASAERPGDFEYRDRGGFVRYSPIGDWSHADVLNVLASYAIDLPPCYSWPRGFRVGTGPWPARQWTDSVAHGWQEVGQIDPQIVENAARHGVEGAREAAECAG